MTIQKLEPVKKPVKTTCPYCGMVPTEKHPDYTCPRLAGASWHDDGGSVDFIDPERWLTIKSTIIGSE